MSDFKLNGYGLFNYLDAGSSEPLKDDKGVVLKNDEGKSVKYTGGLRSLQKAVTIPCEDFKTFEVINPFSKGFSAVRAALNAVATVYGMLWTAISVFAEIGIAIKFKGVTETKDADGKPTGDWKAYLDAKEAWGFTSNVSKTFNHGMSTIAHLFGVLTIPRWGNNFAAYFGTTKTINTLSSKTTSLENSLEKADKKTAEYKDYIVILKDELKIDEAYIKNLKDNTENQIVKDHFNKKVEGEKVELDNDGTPVEIDVNGKKEQKKVKYNPLEEHLAEIKKHYDNYKKYHELLEEKTKLEKDFAAKYKELFKKLEDQHKINQKIEKLNKNEDFKKDEHGKEGKATEDDIKNAAADVKLFVALNINGTESLADLKKILDKLETAAKGFALNDDGDAYDKPINYENQADEDAKKKEATELVAILKPIVTDLSKFEVKKEHTDNLQKAEWVAIQADDKGQNQKHQLKDVKEHFDAYNEIARIAKLEKILTFKV